ncbi:MAG TPA: patatin-like phospholipase family protein [Streptosporangiaceae bacterium]|nr:patatin-like phospholipase family protein [Streptosporangiaceae bacterium]
MADKALVLGGGGLTGVAWEIGMLAGLASHGVDLTDADLVAGTSAGAVVGVDVRSGISLAEFYKHQSAPYESGEIAAKMGWAVLLKYAMAVGLTRRSEVAMKRVGRVGLRSRTVSETERRKVFEGRLPIRDWPAGRLVVTAVETHSGEFTVFEATSGVSLIDAVGASCAVPGVWPPVTINGKRYMDGGMRSATNADLAAGYERIVVIAPLRHGFGPIPSAASQVRKLAADGSKVTLITPDKAALAAIGRNVLDPVNRPAAAKAGFAQAATEAGAVAAIW